MQIPEITKHSRGDVWHHADGSIGYTTKIACDSEPLSTLLKLIIPSEEGFRLLAWRYPFELVEEGWTRISTCQTMFHIDKALENIFEK